MRLLLMEDDTRLAGLLQRGLQAEGHAVDLAASVEDGRWLATENPYDALVFDVMLPDGDGFALCAEIRRAEIWTPVLMLTARDAVSDRVRGLDVGADDYLVKPFAFAELTARLRALARRGAPERPTILTAGTLTIDPAARAVEVDGRPLSLSAREYSLLELFVRHAGDVLTRTEIIERVWDWAYDGTSNVVDVYVRYLRTKLAAHPSAPRIETARGIGYVLRAAGVGGPARARRGRPGRLVGPRGECPLVDRRGLGAAPGGRAGLPPACPPPLAAPRCVTTRADEGRSLADRPTRGRADAPFIRRDRCDVDERDAGLPGHAGPFARVRPGGCADGRAPLTLRPASAPARRRCPRGRAGDASLPPCRDRGVRPGHARGPRWVWWAPATEELLWRSLS